MSQPVRIAGLLAAGVCLLSAVSCNSGSSAATISTGGGGRGGRGAGAGGVVPVVLAKVTQRDVPINIESIGNVEAYSTISVRAQVTGILTTVNFREGDFVRKDSVLFKIDPRPYEAALAQAKANQARDGALESQSEAQLTRDQASAAYARATATRNDELMKRGIISKDQADQYSAAADAADATVNADKATIASAKAQMVSTEATVESAKVQLDYCVITSPIDGRTGDLSLKAGNLVTATSTELVTITELDPIFVTFSMPAVHLPDIKAHLAQGTLQVAATPQTTGAQPVNGSLTFVDNSVDPSTDTIKLKATFANADRVLWPGQFARVSLRLSTMSNATVVPSEAVQTGQDGQFVFVLKPDSTVDLRTVTTGPSIEQDTVITKGLTPGETVVTEGQLRLEPGTRVTRADPRTGEAPAGGGRGGRGGRGPGGAAAGPGGATAGPGAAAAGSVKPQ